MLSAREDIFESNSSSCHSLTLSKKSFADKLKNEEAFYVGPFRSFSDMDETFFNELDETAIVTKEELWQKLVDWARTKRDPSNPNSYEIALADDILKNETFDEFKHFVEVNEKWLPDYIELVLSNYNTYDRMFGGEHCDSYIDEAREYDLADGDKLIVRLVNISC